MESSSQQLSDLVNRGLLISSEDFAIEKLPDGRSKVRFLKSLKSGICPIVPQISVTFTGITFCGCTQAAGGSSANFVGGNPNQTFTVPYTGSGTWTLNPAETFTVNEFSGNSSCGGIPNVQLQPGILTVVCRDISEFPYSAGWTIIYVAQTGVGQFSLFFGHSQPGLYIVANRCFCGGTAPSINTAHGGTATISF